MKFIFFDFSMVRSLLRFNFSIAVVLSLLAHMLLVRFIHQFAVNNDVDYKPNKSRQIVSAFMVKAPEKMTPQVESKPVPEKLTKPKEAEVKKPEPINETPKQNMVADSPPKTDSESSDEGKAVSKDSESSNLSVQSQPDHLDPYKLMTDYLADQEENAISSFAKEARDKYKTGNIISEKYVKPRGSIQEVGRDINGIRYRVKGAFGWMCVTQRGQGGDLNNVSAIPCGGRDLEKAYKEAIDKWVKKTPHKKEKPTINPLN